MGNPHSQKESTSNYCADMEEHQQENSGTPVIETKSNSVSLKVNTPDVEMAELVIVHKETTIPSSKRKLYLAIIGIIILFLIIMQGLIISVNKI